MGMFGTIDVCIGIKRFINLNFKMTQAEIIEGFKRLPYKTYEKFGEVKFETSQKVQEVVTVINGETETTNTAQIGDYILEGVNGEKYVLTPKKFMQNYEIEEYSYSEMKGTAKIKPQPRFAAQWYISHQLIFTADWGEEMICNEGDYLVAPQDFSEVYRIEKSVFEKTYRIC